MDYPKMIYKPNEKRGIRVNSAEEEAAVLGGRMSYIEPKKQLSVEELPDKPSPVQRELPAAPEKKAKKVEEPKKKKADKK